MPWSTAGQQVGSLTVLVSTVLEILRCHRRFIFDSRPFHPGKTSTGTICISDEFIIKTAKLTIRRLPISHNWADASYQCILDSLLHFFSFSSLSLLLFFSYSYMHIANNNVKKELK